MRRGFTLVEVMAALLMMAIVIPVALQGMSTISRTAILGQHKVTAMRIAERVIEEQLMQIQQSQSTSQSSGSGVEIDGDTSYPWTLTSETWAQDNMTQITVQVSFVMQGSTYQMSASTLYDPNANTAGTPQPSSASSASSP